jgi:hypothetical protein
MLDLTDITDQLHKTLELSPQVKQGTLFTLKSLTNGPDKENQPNPLPKTTNSIKDFSKKML